MLDSCYSRNIDTYQNLKANVKLVDHLETLSNVRLVTYAIT